MTKAEIKQVSDKLTGVLPPSAKERKLVYRFLEQWINNIQKLLKKETPSPLSVSLKELTKKYSKKYGIDKASDIRAAAVEMMKIIGKDYRKSEDKKND